MIFKELRNKKIGVLGLGKTGEVIVDFLLANGACVVAYDDNVESVSKCKLVPFKEWDVDFIVLSPGIHLLWERPHECVTWARSNFIPLITDIDLFCLNNKNPIIAVTGTNGKSTTAWVINEILNLAKMDSQIGGNFGIPVLGLGKSSKYVFELSSYQLEGSFVLGFDVSILLNITPDHLDRHGGLFGYAAAKQKIFANFKKNSLAVVSVDDALCLDIYNFLKSIGHPNTLKISGNFVPDMGIGWNGDVLVDARSAESVRIQNLELQGNHNKQNLAAAYAACNKFGISLKQFSDFINRLHALAHRQEIVLEKNGVIYVNDSKATNIDSTEQALKRFSNVYLILGGRPKEDALERLSPYFSKIKHVFLIGEVAVKWKLILDALGVDATISYTLDMAVLSAFKNAISGDVILLSPACASFDQFKSFEERGNAFRALVKNL